VALLGDSFIEAVQVPLPKTAGQLLESDLNARLAQDSGRRWQWEVLNFGISNYGVGQYLLTWEQYARDYAPDFVVIFVARFHMRRTVTKYEYGAFSASRKARLWVRPTFRLDDGVLIREPARDFEAFVRMQEHLLATEFAGQRSRRRRGLITLRYARELTSGLTSLVRSGEQNSRRVVDADDEAKVIALNTRIIEALGRGVTGIGGRLIVLDASRYFGDQEMISDALRWVCGENGFGYVPLYANLMKANAEGASTRWADDGHFNEAGNAIVANVLSAWITRDVSMNRPRS
jgi:hypothetical protein